MTTLVFLIVAYFGLFCHWFKRWAREQTDRDFIRYMTEHRKHSIGSIVSVLAGVATLLSGSPELSQETLSLAFLAGYSIDSMVNK